MTPAPSHAREMRMPFLRQQRMITLLSMLFVCVASACNVRGMRSPGYEQSYLAASHNRVFRNRFPRADQLFNAFDYGHAILYETLLTNANAPHALDGKVFDYVATHVLPYPPRVPLEEAAVGPHYATLVPEVVEMFEWAHLLHRQLYDVLAAPGLSWAARDHEVARLVTYYESRGDLAFSAHPKSMTLMEGQNYSQIFRERAPKFNGLLWSYHWMQMAVYDALMVDTSYAAQRIEVNGVVDRFFGLIQHGQSAMPAAMPMSAGVAPLFVARYPEAAIIFDNLHSLHDVVSDILLSDTVPRKDKRRTILAAAAAYRDDHTAIISVDDWLSMSLMMTPQRLRRQPR